MNRHPKSLAAGLLVAGALSLSAPALATPEEDARLDAMQKQLQQVQATLQQLADENRALREHEKQLDQEVAQLKGQLPATESGATIVHYALSLVLSHCDEAATDRAAPPVRWR